MARGRNGRRRCRPRHHEAARQVVGFGDSRAILPTMLIDVRRSEIPNPALGDTVEIPGSSPGTGTVLEVIATPVADSLGLVWTCEAAPPT